MSSFASLTTDRRLPVSSARMDDAGHIAPVEEVKKKIGEA